VSQQTRNQQTIIDASKRKLFPDFGELFRYKDLFFTLTWRDFRVRYAQTAIGFLWAFIQPIVSLILLTTIFSGIVGVKTEVPGILLTASGVGLWLYFSFVMTNSGDSIIASQNMIKKIYFPRLIIPLSKAIVGFVEFIVALIILIALMIYFGVSPSSYVFMCIPFLLLGILAALGIGIWLSALTVRYRDFKHVVPFMVQIGYFASPIGYPVEMVQSRLPDWASTIYYLNPMAGVIQGFRWALFGMEAPGNMIWVSVAIVITLFITGLMYFNRMEEKMADFV